MSQTSDEQELIALSQRLLDAIDRQDWPVYVALCDPSLSAFEPEAAGHLVEGMPFHKFYFDAERAGRPMQSTLSSCNVRIMGDVAVVAYVRLSQRPEEGGHSTTRAFEETRVWQRQDGQWRNVHFHRSRCGEARV